MVWSFHRWVLRPNCLQSLSWARIIYVQSVMAMLLIVILVITIFFTIAPKFFKTISHQLTKHVIKPSANENDLKEELKRLIKELQSLNMVDEFPKYARTERRINKLKSETQSIAQKRREVFLKMKLGVNVAYHILQVFVFICLIYNFRHEAVVVFPPEWLFPIGSLISFPSGVSGAVSTAVWIVVCRSTIPKLVKFI